jgi:hypothetical protein
MPDSNFKPVDGDVFLQLLDDPDAIRDTENESAWGGNELIPAIIVDAGPDVVGGIKKGATCMVYGYVRDCARLSDNLIVANSYCVAAIVSG